VLVLRVHAFWYVTLCYWVISSHCLEGTVSLQNVGKNSPIDNVTTLKLKHVQEALLIL
jgi:hypothetical protein